MNSEDTNSYIAASVELSITAKAAIALLVFERFVRLNNVQTKTTVELVEHLWHWPLVQFSDQFDAWERTKPKLVGLALGDTIEEELSLSLKRSSIEETRFRHVLEAPVELLWGNFWGAVDNEMSMRTYEVAIRKSRLESLPPLTPFKFSRLSDGNGWGAVLTLNDRDYWRTAFKTLA